MPNMKSLSLTVQKLWPRLKFFTENSYVTEISNITENSILLDSVI